MTFKHCAAVMVAVAGLAGPASAASLTLYDNYQGKGVTQDASVSSVVWTLVVEDGCQQCNVLLTADFTGSQNYYVGSYLDSVQWVVSQPDVTPVEAGFDGFYVNGAAQGTWETDWSFALNQALNANQCNGKSSASDAICGEWIAGGAAGGFGAISQDMQLAWTFDTTFSGDLSTAVTGNIRGAFNTGQGKNLNIFSPGGGTFETGGCSEVGGCLPPDVPDTPTATPVPEPMTLLMLGSGLLAVGIKFRRR